MSDEPKRFPGAYWTPVYGAPSPRPVAEPAPCAEHALVCIICGQHEPEPISEAVVAAVRAYQERWRGDDCNRTFSSALRLLEAIEADAKEREG